MTAPFIMLVDDEASFVETMAKRLSKRNVRTISAFSGKECLEKLEANQDLDVIVLDVKMPDMDGLETLKEIKKRFPLMSVIMLTGHATVDSAISGMKLGAYDFLTKPCDIEELAGKVEEAARNKRTHQIKMENWEKYMQSSTLENIMVPLAEYATVSEDASILEAINALSESQMAFDPKRYRHRAVLVLDKESRVVGKLSQHDIIRSLEPKYKESKEHKKGALDHFGFSRSFIDTIARQYDLWDRPLENLYKKAVDQKARSFMHKPTEGEYIDVSATMNDTLHQLIVGNHHSLLVTDGPKIVGIVRLTDVFEFIRLRLDTMQLAARSSGEANPPDSV